MSMFADTLRYDLDYEYLDREQQNDLAMKAKEDPAYREHAVRSVIPMLLSQAAKFRWVDKRDLVNGAALAILERGFQKYDPSKGDWFSYARSVARNAMLDICNRQRLQATGDYVDVEDEPCDDCDWVDSVRHRVDVAMHSYDTLLTEEQQLAVSLYFGLDGNLPHTFACVGRKMGYSGENARLQVRRALRKLKVNFADLERTGVNK